jgi:hypothetical protein
MRNILIGLFILATVPRAMADKVNGRVEVGGYASQEHFANTAGGSAENDFQLFTFRSFLSVSEMGAQKFEFNSDVRDKYDFFDKLNKQQLTLDANNTFQVQQLNFRKPVQNDTGLGYTVGRTPIPEAGGAFNDGVLVRYHFLTAWDYAAFGGLNPKIPGQAHLDWNSKASTYGTFLSYAPKSTDWNKSFYLTNAFVTQVDEGHTDREYLFQNLSYQWQNNSRLITYLFLDFVPRTYIQEGSVFWQNEWTEKTYSKVTLLGVDSIEYVHIQGKLEDLPASPYKQATVAFDYRQTPLLTWEIATLIGHRNYDGFSKTEVALSMAHQRSFGPKWDSSFTVGYRDNFVSHDEFGRAAVGYYSRIWEGYFNLEAGIEKYSSQTLTHHPLIAEFGVSYFVNKQLYLTGSLERAANEDVQIFSVFTKLGYRYGNREIPPLRDGSPVKGSL